MITLELLIENPKSSLRIGGIRLGYDLDSGLKSDRSPSLWQDEIINKCDKAELIHIFDRSFINSSGARWLYEDIIDKDWKRFRFIDELRDDFIKLVTLSIENSSRKRVWVMTDAQYGPAPKVYSEQTVIAFISYYQRFGLRLNSAICVTDRTTFA